jgi:hypothetical protein
MAQMARDAAHGPIISSAVDEAIAGLGNDANDQQLVSRVFYWVKSRVRFKTDEEILQNQMGMSPESELLIAPDALLTMPNAAGDCDDFSTLIAAMLINLGFPVYFCTIAANGKYPDEFSHVYIKVQMSDGTLFPIDCSHGMYPGWETGQNYLEQLWGINSMGGMLCA